MMVVHVLERLPGWESLMIRKAMLRLTYEGVTGKIRFLKNGDAQREMIIMKIEKGKRNYMMTLKMR